MMKGFRLLAFMLLVLTLVSSSIMAITYVPLMVDYGSNSSSSFINLDSVKVNGQTLASSGPTGAVSHVIALDRGQEVVVELQFTGNPQGVCTTRTNNPCYNVRASAEINGYEYGEIRGSIGPFKVEPGVQYMKTIKFRLPEDMPANKDVNIVIQLDDENNLIFLHRYPVRIQLVRHSVNVYDVIFNPLNNVQAGQPLFTTIRIENMGDNKESSVKATVAIPALGIQTSEYVDKLLSDGGRNPTNDRDADEAATTNDLLLMIPQDAKEGDYKVIVALEYNRGASLEKKEYLMHIKGAQALTPPLPTIENKGLVVTVAAQAQKVNSGEGAVYKFSFANLGQQATTYSLEVLGTSDWATIRVDPTNVVLQSDGTADAYVYVAPKEDVVGVKSFTVKIKNGNNVLQEKNLSLEVVKAESNVADVKTIFTWIFIVLLGILVILVIVVIVKNLTSKNTPGKGVEGQSYY